MQHAEQQNRQRHYHDVQGIKAQQRERLTDAIRYQQAAQQFAEGCRQQQFHTGLGGPVGQLIHGQQIAGVGLEDAQQQEQHADHPVQLARAMVGPGQDDPQGMEKQQDQQGVGGQAVQAAQVRAAPDDGLQKQDRIEGPLRCRLVVDQQQYAAGQHDQEGAEG